MLVTSFLSTLNESNFGASPLGCYPSASSPICLRTGAAGTSNSPFPGPRPLMLCFSAHRHCSGSKEELIQCITSTGAFSMMMYPKVGGEAEINRRRDRSASGVVWNRKKCRAGVQR